MLINPDTYVAHLELQLWRKLLLLFTWAYGQAEMLDHVKVADTVRTPKADSLGWYDLGSFNYIAYSSFIIIKTCPACA